MASSSPTRSKKEPSLPSLATGTAGKVASTTSFSSASSLSSSLEPLSSGEILERTPTPVVRLLAALGPFIHGTNRLVRLATWTGGRGSGASSMLLLVSFWLTCAFGYEFIRYAPQLLILGWITYTGLRRQLSFAKPRTYSAKTFEKHDVISAATINATLAELSELVDFFSSLRKNVLIPAVQLVSWDPSPMHTKAVAAFVLLSWPIWLAAFLPLRESGFPSLVLPVSGAGILAFFSNLFGIVYAQILRLIGSEHLASLQSRASPLFERVDQVGVFVSKTPLPVVYAHSRAILGRVRWEQWTDFNITLLPPYPIGALTVRSLVCFTGTILLTWCSPWCSLFRQAVWKSATVRRLVRGTGRVLSGQTPFREAYGKGNLDDEWANGLYDDDGTAILSSKSTGAGGDNKAKVKLEKGSNDEEKVVRHEDVIYQFSIFENQRWWVGLDWTAALLPQERPSWSDESNNPVSPPSSFSLPPTKIMLTPSPTPKDSKAFTRRTIKWQWLDPEWSVAGVSSGGYYPSSTVYKGSAKEAAIKSATAVGDKDALAAAKQGYLGDALNRIRARASGGANAESSSPAASSIGDVGTTAVPVSTTGETEEWDVDTEGWQYGDNAWDKMSKKSGMGRYTRRRKWVRRAVLLEIVEHGVHNPAPPSGGSNASVAASGTGTGYFPSSPSQADVKTESTETDETQAQAKVKEEEDEHDLTISTDVTAATTSHNHTDDPSASPTSSPNGKRPSVSDRLAKAAQ
ncbi:hypothetical protein BCV70DRAFT_199996 [Testicularia cyperi]|uniref:Peroxin/Ferlin domain-containing protein n=1 Tax=Testicularia cyperi TaxID=1882483 RepID=A0A317XRL4_9BASI|nr:hypothetical protein BCV70DRAFT_199996 [Testicularia cyperi]